jgi:competence protein ComGC
MKKKLILLFSALLLLYSCNVSNNKSHLQEYGINGNVKSTKISSFSAEEKFGEPTKIGLKGDRTEYVHSERIFNDKGNIEEENFYDVSESLLNRYRYQYNSEEKISSIIEYNSEGKEMGKSLFEYSDNEKTVQLLDQNGEIKYLQKAVLDEKGNKIKASIFDRDNKLIVVNKDEYKNNNRISSKTYNTNGELDFYWKFQHDDYGNEIVEESYNNKDVLQDKIKYKYEYDHLENWITKTKFVNGTPTLIFERKIQYR